MSPFSHCQGPKVNVIEMLDKEMFYFLSFSFFYLRYVRNFGIGIGPPEPIQLSSL